MKKGVTKSKRHVVDVGSQIGAGSIECSMAKVSKLDQNRAHVIVTRELLLYPYFGPDRRSSSNNCSKCVHMG